MVRRALRSHARTKERTGTEHAPCVRHWDQLYKNVNAGDGVILVVSRKGKSK